MGLNDQEIDLDDGISDMKDEAGAPVGAEQPAAADSSNATDANETEETSVLSIVRDAVGEKKEETPAASSATGEEDASTDDPAAGPDDENYSDVPFHKHPRFQSLLTERNTFKQDATRYRNVQTFLDEQGLGAEETAELLEIGGLMKRNPAEAWARMKPQIQQLLISAGEFLPDDLRQRVQAGELTQDAAIEVSRSRAKVQSIEHSRSFEQQRIERQQEAEKIEAVKSAANSWAADRALKDPNFDAKMPALQREIAWRQSQEGRPNTPDGVRKQLKECYDAVNATFQPPAPVVQKAPVTPVRGGRVAGDVRPEPKSVLDIVRAQRQSA